MIVKPQTSRRFVSSSNCDGDKGGEGPGGCPANWCWAGQPTNTNIFRPEIFYIFLPSIHTQLNESASARAEAVLCWACLLNDLYEVLGGWFGKIVIHRNIKLFRLGCCMSLFGLGLLSQAPKQEVSLLMQNKRCSQKELFVRQLKPKMNRNLF